MFLRTWFFAVNFPDDLVRNPECRSDCRRIQPGGGVVAAVVSVAIELYLP